MSSTQGFQRLRAGELADWLSAHPDALILDARDERHHALGHLNGSVRLDGRNHERLLMRESKTRPVLIYCYHGNASQTYADMFVDFGFACVADLMGGWEAWMQSGPQASTAEAAAGGRSTNLDEAVPPFLQTWLSDHEFEHINEAGAHGNTPLMEAAWRGETAIVQALIDLGVNLHATNGDGNNALWLACVSNDPALVILLAQAGVAIDHLNATGATCLMYAASSSKPDIVRVLLALGADPLIQTQDDFSALDMAASLACLQLLRSATKSASKVTA
ncbi:MAG: ankyrin repeat domain-containing protein [Aquabacterium sp.]|uniref:ankyrin repeat domain-containing protein n=1 Tax=Aquabacterium sp. TaxID=1872578 RepID=UPI0025BAA025|nr:ankyrin repeat domain-containing protein [Aquabacterium sp.]MBI5927336.1 ankyrin repeat domain-containing protein [Aquabacterium sp.]